MLLPAAIKSFTKIGSVELLNLSATGARLRGSDLPPVNDCVLIRAEAVEAFGTVVWNDDGLCGVHFDEPLSPLQIHNLEHESELSIMANQSPQERMAAEDWATGYAR